MSAWKLVGIELSLESSATSRLFLLTFHYYEALAYKVTITGITGDNSAHIIVRPEWTVGLLTSLFGGLL